MNRVINCLKPRSVWSSRVVSMSGPIQDAIERYEKVEMWGGRRPISQYIYIFCAFQEDNRILETRCILYCERLP